MDGASAGSALVSSGALSTADLAIRSGALLKAILVAHLATAPLLQLLAPLSFSTLDDLLIARLDFPPGRLGLLVLAILCCRDCGEREAQA